MLRDVFKRAEEKGIKIDVTERFKDRLVDEGYNPAYGARPLRRAIMRLLEDSMAERMLAGDIKEGDSVILDGERRARAPRRALPGVVVGPPWRGCWSCLRHLYRSCSHACSLLPCGPFLSAFPGTARLLSCALCCQAGSADP